MSIEGQGHFFTIYFPGFACFVLYKATISGECLQDHWSSGLFEALRPGQQFFSYFGMASWALTSTQQWGRSVLLKDITLRLG